MEKRLLLLMALCMLMSCAACAVKGNDRTQGSTPQGETPQEGISQGGISQGGTSQEDAALGNQAANPVGILDSYYSGQSSEAFEMLKEPQYADLPDEWVPAGIEDPAWEFDTFTEYKVYYNGTDAGDWDGRELYCCCFSASPSKCGFVVLEYDGDSFGYVSSMETKFTYDLAVNIGNIAESLNAAGLDISSAEAERVLVVNEKEGIAADGILFADGKGVRHVCYFDTVIIL